MEFKKYDGSTWQLMTPKKLKGIPYTGTLPATLTGTKVGYLHKYKIYGNTEQTGTPTPENPIELSECGERTENLFNFNRQRSDTFALDSTKYIYAARADHQATAPGDVQELVYNDNSFTILSTGGGGIGFLVEVKPNTTYTMLYQCDATIPIDRTSAVLNVITSNGSFGKYWAIYGDSRSSTFTTNANTAYVYLVFRAINYSATYSNIMLIEGSTAPSTYIPYGYKLPLTSSGQNVDVYLGESQTTRRIKKLVLTGEENYTYQSEYFRYVFTLSDALAVGLRKTRCFCTHYQSVYHEESITDIPDKSIYINYQVTGPQFCIKDETITSLADFKTYLTTQYANGTPVTIWYVLATEETGIVNEPLRKIGDYVDIIDSTQIAAQIPTSADSTTISWAGSGLAPSEFDSIQEWVNIATYTYTNGEWVTDNQQEVTP